MKHLTLAESLAQVLAEKGFSIAGLQPDLAHVFESGCEKTPDLLLLAPRNETRALAELRALTHRIGEISVVLLAHPENWLEWVAAGVRGFSSPDQPVAELVETLQGALRRDGLSDPSVAYQVFAELARLERRHRLEHRSQASTLTTREREILSLLCDGMANRKIASQLCLSTHTVKNHVHHLLSKLGVESRWEAAAKARQRGWMHELRRG